MATYTLRQTGDTHYELLRDGHRVIGLGGDRAFAEGTLAEYRDQELEASVALAMGEPEALCLLRWHRGGIPSPVAAHVGASAFYFRFETKIGEADGTLVFRVAEGPFLYLARTVKSLGILDPWHCAVCGNDVGADRTSPQVGTWRSQDTRSTWSSVRYS
jgi:hypothetical protein